LSSKEWAKWNILSHLQLHKLQVRLLCRALQLTKKGGRIVYSTCSLDPIENEAVVASAIVKMGGPDVYKIVSLPPNFRFGSESETQPFQYTPGATSWIVPNPKFSATNQAFYHTYDDVPSDVRKRHIQASMFPPRFRITREEDGAASAVESNVSSEIVDDVSENSSGDKSDGETIGSGDYITKQDAVRLEKMLSNCCRILPQHLDSGGFFCAVIERSSPSYYAICCPQQRSKETISSKCHGRIYHPVESAQQIRDMVSDEKENGEKIYFEGHASLETAIQWLQQHGAFIEEYSNMPIPVPEPTSPASALAGPATKKAKHVNKDEPRQPLYTPLFEKPHPLLVKEFCDFYGLCLNSEAAKEAKVDIFPAEDIVLVGGSPKGADVTSCISIEEDDGKEVTDKANRSYKFLRLGLASKEVQSLFAGAAKFNPMEVGLTLCWVPIPGSGSSRPKLDIVQDATKSKESQSSTFSIENRSRYGLSDEAAEVVGRYATRRLVDMPRDDILKLLELSRLDGSHIIPKDWSDGGIIVRYIMDNNERTKIFLSCKLTKRKSVSSDDASFTIDLLTERRFAASWLRLLKAQPSL
jgi:hypothetical protein